MFNKDKAFKISTITLFIVAILDICRGFAHTFIINWASANVAQIEPIADSLLLMGSFGIANFLSGFTYLLLLKKAKHLAPHMLALIPSAYALGVIGLKLSKVQAESSFNGRYMMFIYLGVCALVSIYYFISAKREKNHETASE